jgi:diadenosine tetraphosphate (Ap4A) HIT family hydrolase
MKTGEIPSFKLFESNKTLAFLDIGPLSKGHAVSRHRSAYSCSRECEMLTDTPTQLVIPKFHGAKLTDIPDDHLSEILVCPY